MLLFKNPAPHKILKIIKNLCRKMASLRHLCRSLQRSAKMGQMTHFTPRSRCKDGLTPTVGISTIYPQWVWVHLCNFLWGFLWCATSLRRLCVVFASVFADLCFDIRQNNVLKNPKIPLKKFWWKMTFLNTFLCYLM